MRGGSAMPVSMAVSVGAAAFLAGARFAGFAVFPAGGVSISTVTLVSVGFAADVDFAGAFTGLFTGLPGVRDVAFAFGASSTGSATISGGAASADVGCSVGALDP
jgi:hypothetical protein